MPTKGTKSPKIDGHTSPSAKAPRVKFQGYVNFSPDEKQRSLYKDALDQGYDYHEYLTDLCIDGYDLKYGHDTYHSAFVANIYCKDTSSSNAGWTLQARGRNPEEAMSRVIFYHVFLLKGKWGQDSTPVQDPERW
jgi:hypothetical protein